MKTNMDDHLMERKTRQEICQERKRERKRKIEREREWERLQAEERNKKEWNGESG